ncbi:uncharacterized protein LOC111099195 [Crassostrea virginica]|uniref:Fibrillin-1-like n=1 Tax=Crassostrea virginica TaxID=6565 RepID=A0A8B8C8G8_CRAVI|nr:fibrillin-1-like [Crassostrea virginica]
MEKYMVVLTALVISSATAQLSLHSENLVRMFSDYLLSDEQNFQLQRETRGVELDGYSQLSKRNTPVSYKVQNFALWYEPASGMRFCETNQSVVFQQCIDTSVNCPYLKTALRICEKPDAAKNLGCLKTCNLCHDKCATGENNCHSLADCHTAEDSFTCLCRKGYEGDGVTSCSDIDECSTNKHNCLQNQICKNTIGGYNCLSKAVKTQQTKCLSGYTLKNGKCEDINECTSGLAACDKNAFCTNTQGSYVCRCKVGYVGSGSFCREVNECLDKTDTCDKTTSVCLDTVGSYSCRCKIGYTEVMGKCVDIDECRNGTHKCSPHATCINNPGSYRCTCRAGFRGDGFKCQDVDECSSGERNFCDKGASCTNTFGSYTCTCPKGYYGSGLYCHDINECARRSTNRCHSRAKCTNTPGSYTCACLDGYTGDGISKCNRKSETKWSWWG